MAETRCKAVATGLRDGSRCTKPEDGHEVHEAHCLLWRDDKPASEPSLTPNGPTRGLLSPCEGCKQWVAEDTIHPTDDDVMLCPSCMAETIKDTAEFIAANPEEAADLGLIDEPPQRLAYVCEHMILEEDCKRCKPRPQPASVEPEGATQDRLNAVADSLERSIAQMERRSGAKVREIAEQVDWPTHCAHGILIDGGCEKCKQADYNYVPPAAVAGDAPQIPPPPIPAGQSWEEYYKEAYRRTLESEGRLLAALAAERARTQQLEKALQWYAADTPRDTFYIVTAKDRGFLSDMADWGEKARAALSHPTQAATQEEK